MKMIKTKKVKISGITQIWVKQLKTNKDDWKWVKSLESK